MTSSSKKTEIVKSKGSKEVSTKTDDSSNSLENRSVNNDTETICKKIKQIMHRIFPYLVCILYFLLPFLLCLFFYHTSDNPIDKTVKASEAVMIAEYEIHIDLYKNYMTLSLNAVSFFFLITGGILAYILKIESPTKIKLPLSGKKVPRENFALFLPILLGNILCFIFIYGAFKWSEVKEAIDYLRESLKIQKVPDVEVLWIVLIVFGIVFLVVGLTLIIFLYYDDKNKNAAISTFE